MRDTLCMLKATSTEMITRLCVSWSSFALASLALATLVLLETHAVLILCLVITPVVLYLVPIVDTTTGRLQKFHCWWKRRQIHGVPVNEHKDKYLAMDCEMVGVGPSGRRSALARVSIVDWDLKVVFDTYVQVMDRVTDYRTPVSGIRPKHLKGPNAMNFRKCREHVLALMKDKIIVGHGLENDFDALRIQHPDDWKRDSSLYEPLQRYDSGRWRSRKLRELVQDYLGTENFQKGEHDSIQDAIAVMQLYHIFHRKWELSIQATK